jgi:transcriptional regulator with XRE-family HTH domain
MSIGKRLKEYITERRLTQDEFSSLCHVNKQTISNIVKDKTAPSGDVLVKIASGYDDLNFNWLITGRGSMFNDISDLDDSTKKQFYASSQSNLQILLDEKDKVISSQRETIEALKEIIGSYKEAKKDSQG